MSEVRKLTAAQLAADDDTARAVWAGVANDTLEVIDGWGDFIYGITRSTGRQHIYIGRIGDDNTRMYWPTETFDVQPTRNALAARLAAVEAWAAAQPDTPPDRTKAARHIVTTMHRIPVLSGAEVDAALEMLQARYAMAQEVRALLKGEAE